MTIRHLVCVALNSKSFASLYYYFFNISLCGGKFTFGTADFVLKGQMVSEKRSIIANNSGE